MPLDGRKPTKAGWRKTNFVNGQILDHDDNLGWCIGPEYLVIDVDVKKQKKGEESFAELSSLFPELIPTVSTPSGGMHIYVHLDTIYSAKAIRKKHILYPDIDFLTEGAYVLIPGCKTNGVSYDLEDDLWPSEWVQMTDELYDHLTDSAHEAAPLDEENDLGDLGDVIKSDSTYDRDAIKSMLKVLDPDMNHDDWVRVGMALHAWDEKEGLKLWGGWSKQSDQFSKSEVLGKWRSFKPGGVTVGSLVHMARGAGWNVSDGDTGNDWADWVWVDKHQQYIRPGMSSGLSKSGLNNMMSCMVPPPDKGPRPSASAWLEKGGYLSERTVTGFTYLPNKPMGPVVDLGEAMYNTFDPATLTPPAAVITPEGQKAIDVVKEHLLLVCNGSQKDASILEQWIAHNVQYPGKKILWAPLFQGVQGTGKTSIAKILSVALGESHVRTVSSSRFKDGARFNSWAAGRLVNVLEELKITGHNRHDIEGALKELITNETIDVEAKGRDSYNVRNTVNYICFTNHMNALPLSSDDRRYWVIYIGRKDRDSLPGAAGMSYEEYFNRYHSALRDHGREICRWLTDLEIDMSLFGAAAAPETEFKHRMISAEVENIAGYDEIVRIIEENETDFINEVAVSRRALQDGFEARRWKLPPTVHRTRILHHLGYTEDKKISREINGNQEWFYVKPEIGRPEVIAAEEAKEGGFDDI
jgi:hypothetical protein